MPHSMNNTKAQLLAAVTELEAQNMRQARELRDLRHLLSVAQGELALRTRSNGPVIERHGQRTIKRWPAVPAPSAPAHRDSYVDPVCAETPFAQRVLSLSKV